MADDVQQTTDWPGRRGVPPNPDRDGWHFLRWLGIGPEPEPQLWSAQHQAWLIDGETMGPGWVGPQTEYRGPATVGEVYGKQS